MYLILGSGEKINVWHNIQIKESILVENISQEDRLKIKDTIKVKYFITENKTWNIRKMSELLPKIYCR